MPRPRLMPRRCPKQPRLFIPRAAFHLKRSQSSNATTATRNNRRANRAAVRRSNRPMTRFSVPRRTDREISDARKDKGRTGTALPRSVGTNHRAHEYSCARKPTINQRNANRSRNANQMDSDRDVLALANLPRADHRSTSDCDNKRTAANKRRKGS